MSTQLIQVFDGSIANETSLLCNARDLHAFLEIGRDFSNWIRNRLSEYEFVANIDYIVFTPNLAKMPGRRRKEYHLTLDTAKELAMVERNDKGRQIRRYFIECEKKLRGSTSTVPATYDKRVLCYERAGVTIHRMPLRDNDLVIAMESWLELARRDGWIVIRRDEFASRIAEALGQYMLTH